MGALPLPGNDESYEKKDNVDNCRFAVATRWAVVELEKDGPGVHSPLSLFFIMQQEYKITV